MIKVTGTNGGINPYRINPFTDCSKITISGNYNKGQWLAIKRCYLNYLHKVTRYYEFRPFYIGKMKVKLFVGNDWSLHCHIIS